MQPDFPHTRNNVVTAEHPDLRWGRLYPTAWHMELFLAICSAWAAMQMWLWPDEFVIGHVALSLSQTLGAKEQTWAAFCGVAAVLKLGGLASRLWGQRDLQSGRLAVCSVCPHLAVGSTILGLFMSVAFWTIVAVSLAMDAPHSVSPIVLAGMALGAAVQLAEWKPAAEPCA